MFKRSAASFSIDALGALAQFMAPMFIIIISAPIVGHYIVIHVLSIQARVIHITLAL